MAVSGLDQVSLHRSVNINTSEMQMYAEMDARAQVESRKRDYEDIVSFTLFAPEDLAQKSKWLAGVASVTYRREWRNARFSNEI